MKIYSHIHSLNNTKLPKKIRKKNKLIIEIEFRRIIQKSAFELVRSSKNVFNWFKKEQI